MCASIILLFPGVFRREEGNKALCLVALLEIEREGLGRVKEEVGDGQALGRGGEGRGG